MNPRILRLTLVGTSVAFFAVLALAPRKSSTRGVREAYAGPSESGPRSGGPGPAPSAAPPPPPEEEEKTGGCCGGGSLFGGKPD